MSIEGIRKHYKEYEKVSWEFVDIYKTISESETAKKILIKIRLRKGTVAHFKYRCLLELLEAGQTELVSSAKLVKCNVPDILAFAKDYSKLASFTVMPDYMAYPILVHIQLRKALGSRIGWGGVVTSRSKDGLLRSLETVHRQAKLPYYMLGFKDPMLPGGAVWA